MTPILGLCQICGKASELGEGLCVDCWDTKVEGLQGKLSKRELKVLDLLTQGLENPAIALKLDLNTKAVSNCIRDIGYKAFVPKGLNKRVWIAINRSKIRKELG
jgi:DNA-binding NarL/FixJ family response regulator